ARGPGHTEPTWLPRSRGFKRSSRLTRRRQPSFLVRYARDAVARGLSATVRYRSPRGGSLAERFSSPFHGEVDRRRSRRDGGAVSAGATAPPPLGGPPPNKVGRKDDARPCREAR